MADTKISALAAAGAAAGANEIAINEAGTTKKLTVTQLAAFIPSEDQVKVATVSLSTANIAAMFGTPVEVIAAPGAGKVIQMSECLVSFTYGGTQYTGGDDLILIEETSSTNLFGYIIAAAEVQGTANIVKSVYPPVAKITVVSNKSILVTNGVGAFATGNGTIKLFLKYRIITL